MSASKSAPELPEKELKAPVENNLQDDELRLGDAEQPLSDELADALEEADPEEAQNEEENQPIKEELAAKEPLDEGIPDDPVTDKAIEEIVAEEGDAVLAAEDQARDLEETPLVAPKKDSRLKKLLQAIWQDPKKRWAAIGSLLVLIFAVVLIPHSRYFVLNTVGVRASLELRVIDGGTLQPLKNVTVRAGGSQAQTDSDGKAKLEKVRLGRTTLHIEKRAFSMQERGITVGWGSNPLGEFQATAVGSQYTFFIKDAFSGKPIAKAEAASGEGNASSDDEGKMVLTLDTAEQEDDAQISVQISAANYRTEVLNITVNNKETQEIKMVPSRRHVFVSKRSGKYDVYTIDADGKNEQRIVGGTGLERDDIALVPHPTANVAALVSTRENTRNANGYLLSTLYIVDTTTGDLMKIDQSEQVKIVGWSDGGRLVYAKIAAGASGTDPKRHRLMSFNNNNHSDTKELASSNSFNDVLMANDKVYYAPSNIFQEAKPAMYVVNPDGSGQQTILDKEVFTIVRGDYDTLYFSAGKEWYEYVLGSGMAAKTQAPSSQNSRLYIDNSNNAFSLWIDDRDGKGVLIDYEIETKEEKTLHERGGLKLPMYWLNEKYIVFRVADGRETADYIFNTEGGEPKKITDVTDTSGISRWFYY